MYVNIGPHVYTIRITTLRTLGLSDYLAREIKICRTVPPAQRLDILLHEVCESWMHHVPHPYDREALCDLFATMAASAMIDLSHQGGIEALERLGVEFIDASAGELRYIRDEYSQV